MANVIIDERGKNKEEIEAMEVAEAAREDSWQHPSFVADLFMGKIQWDSLIPFPEQPEADRIAGEPFLKALKEFFETQVDADKIDADGLIPQSVLDGLAKLGAMGIKIPKEYGGLGLSQTNYARAMALMAGYCGSTTVTISAHQSIGVPQPLLMFGTDEQKTRFLPRFAKGEISAFALTEPEVGSDPARLSTTAVPTEDGNHYILNGTKLWCTNGAIADIMVVMVQTPAVVSKGKERKQISAFIVEKNMPGFEVLHRCRFMGLNGIQNALLKFTNVKVPKENLIWGLGKGLKLALITLNAGRLSLPAGCVGVGRKMIESAREWGTERVQWGAPIGKHEFGAAKVASLVANEFAMEAITWLSCHWSDAHDRDIRLEAAMSKLHCTVRSEVMVQETLQLRGGRGYETGPSLAARGEKNVPVERWLRDSRINQIVEGTNEILKLFIAREALDGHLKVAGDVLNPKLSIGTRIIAAVKAFGFYAIWYPKQWLGAIPLPTGLGLPAKLQGHAGYIRTTSHRLARSTFHLMAQHGPKLEKKQMQLGRIVDIATDLFAMAAAVGYAGGRKTKVLPEGTIESADYFCREARDRIETNFQRLSCNHDSAANRLAAKVTEGKMQWQEKTL